MGQLAFVFPGQGAQAVGMLAGFAGNSAVAQTIAKASEALGQNLEDLIANGPEQALSLTVNTQPVMLATSVGFYQAWIAAGGPEPLYAAGHSLGEYSALTAAGVFNLTDAVCAVRFRAQQMQDAVPIGEGTMAAILGLDTEAVIGLCRDAAQDQTVEAVNFNAPDQTVIAGHQAAVERACVLAKERGAKRALGLAVSAPFHSSLLKPAAKALRGYLATMPMNPPRFKVINNVDVAIESEPEQIRDALSRQAMSPVRWVEVIQRMREEGVSSIVECGPGKVLSGLIKRIAPEISCSSINDQASLQAALEQLK